MIEEILNKLIDALNANTEVQAKILDKLNSAPAAKAEEKPKTTRRGRPPKKAEPAEEKAPEAEAKEEPVEEKPKAKKPAKSSKDKGITKDALLKEFKEFLKKATEAGRKDEAVKLVREIAQEYGADKVTETKAEDWPSMLADLKDRSEAFFASEDGGEEDIL